MIQVEASDFQLITLNKNVDWNFQGRLKPPKPPLHDAPASPVFARRREVTFLCRERKRKQLGHEASPLLGSLSGTIYLTIWGTLP